MTSQNDPQHRVYHQSDPGRVHLREEDSDGVFVVRMPLASTGEVRNDGDDPLTDEEIQGMADQVDTQSPGVFLDHGMNADVAGSRYSATGKVGEWQNPDLVENDAGETLLEADARLMDPDTLDESTGSVREALAALKAQVDRDIGLSSSIGWREDDGFSGGVDLMEASIVGIPADPRTTSHDAAVDMARAALDARGDGADPEQLVADFRAVVMGPDAGEDRHLSSQQADLALEVLNEYRASQGDGSVENFESWLWSKGREFDEDTIHAARTALQEFYRDTTPLDDPVSNQYQGWLADRADDESSPDDTNDMTEQESEQSGNEPDNENDGSDGMDDSEFRESMLEMQREQTETLRTLADALREDDDDDEGGDGEDDEDDGEDDDGEQSADNPATTQTVEVDGEEVDVQEMVDDHRDTLAALRAGGVSLDDVDLGDAGDVVTDADRDTNTDTDADAGGEESRDNQPDDTNSSADSAGWLA
jgi:hypothetical protein